MAITIADRFSRLNRLPDLCSICNLRQRQQGEGFERAVLTQAVIDMEGNLEFCETCMSEVATRLGFLAPAGVAELKSEVAELQAERDALTERVEEQAIAVKSLTNELNAAFEPKHAKAISA